MQHQGYSGVWSYPERMDEGETYITYNLIYVRENGYSVRIFLPYNWHFLLLYYFNSSY